MHFSKKSLFILPWLALAACQTGNHSNTASDRDARYGLRPDGTRDSRDGAPNTTTHNSNAQFRLKPFRSPSNTASRPVVTEKPRPSVVTTSPKPTPKPTLKPTPKPKPAPEKSPVKSTPSTSGTDQPEPAATPKPSSSPTLPPFASPVPGKKGFVTSPYSPTAGFIDVTGLEPGSQAKDPYTGKIFRVP